MDAAHDAPTVPPLNPHRTGAYLRRLGVDHPPTVDAATLADLHERHLCAIPFENLSIHLGEPIVLDTDALVDKLTVRHRGGFCYELNGAFAALLTTLGFDVALFEARVGAAVEPGGPDTGTGTRFDHLCLRVRIDDRAYLADVGFGASFLRPLELGRTGPQVDPAGTYEIVDAGSGHFDMVEEGRPQFRFSAVERDLTEFAGGSRHHQTSPDSHFARDTVCSLATPTGRVTISGRTLVVTEGGQRREREIASDDELLALYREHFGIALDRVPGR